MIKPGKIIGIVVIGGALTYFRLTAPPPAPAPAPTSTPAPAPAANVAATPAPALPTASTPFVRVVLTKAGVLAVDGKEASLPEVAAVLDGLASKKGIILYARETPAEAEPPPAAAALMELVVQKKLPLRVCRSADFSDDVGPDGKLKIGE
jgi:hypothetical protein